MDFSVHSTTKYIGGHGDVLGGAIISSKKDRAVLHEIIKMTGGNQTKAARLLDITRDALRYRMQKFGFLQEKV